MLPLYFVLSRINQARSPPITMHSITVVLITHTCARHQHPHQPAYKSTHLTPVQCPISFLRSGLILLKLVTCLLTFISYLPPVSSPACSSQLYSIVRVSQDFHESVSIDQDCEVCTPFPWYTSSCESKGFTLSPSSYYCVYSLNLLLTSISNPLTPPIAIKLTCCILTICLLP